MKKLFLLAVALITMTAFAQKDTNMFIRPTTLVRHTVDSFYDIDMDTIPQVTDYGPRRLYFIHGLGGNKSSWTKVPDACWNPYLNGQPNYFARHCVVSRPDYSGSTTASLSYAAYEVSQQIHTQNVEDYYYNNINPNNAILTHIAAQILKKVKRSTKNP